MKDSTEPIVIAIDGPAGAGKSTVARGLAAALGVRFLDTGAMYRAVTLLGIECGLDLQDGEALGRLAQGLDFRFDTQGQLWLGERQLEPEIRSSEVTANVSQVSAHWPVREAIVAQQQEFGRSWEGLVAEGRDTTTVVFPVARFRFYLDASATVRAKRRSNELGIPDQADRIQREIEARDAFDSGREHSPLQLVEGVVHIDTDGIDPDGVIAKLLGIVRSSVS